MRSVPDVVVNADPFQGIEICEASNGGCPNGLQYAGTSFAAPQWASFAALLNQTIGTNQGLLNPLLYPLAAGGGFHQPGALGSDFAHVGLGSPNLNALFLQLTAQSAGAVSASNSAMAISLDTVNGALPPGLADDGTTAGTVTIWLRDANGNSVAGKTVTLSAIAGTSVKISPASAVTTADNGAVNFQITDTAAESPTLTATDTTDGVTLTQQLIGDFAVAPAAAAGLNVFPTTVTGDGVTPTDITVTLNDSLGRPTPGKTVLITQTGGNSVISGPVPAVTNSNGMISFTAVDSNDETVTYSAVDVTDGYVPFPTTGTVTFDNAPEPGCSTTLPMAPDYIATPYAQGFLAQSYSFGNINFNGCGGVYGMAFDSSGNLFAADQVNGNLYKFPPGGGLVGSATLLGTLGPSLQGLAFDKSGNLYGSRDATTGNFFTGAVMQIDPANASIIQTVSGLTCPSALSVDPLSDDLFTDDSCFGSGADNSALWRISGLPTTPVLSVYANLPHTPNANIAFAPSGTMYVWDSGQDAKVTATNGPTPPVVTVLPGLGQANLGLLAFGMQSNGDANYLITNFPPDTSITPNGPPTASIFDLTATPPAVSSTIIGYGSAENLIVGPDGCVYAAQGTGIWRITDSAGLCTYAAPVPAASLVLTPVLLFPSPTQGSPITLTAAFHNTTVTTGTPVVFTVTGANPQSQQVLSTAAGIAAFTYTAAKQGVDTIVARATAGTTPLTSNQSVITWGPGSDVTFLSLNGSPTTAMPNLPTTVVANLTDVSVTPVAPVAGQTVSFLINGAGGCSAVTDASGNATCALTAGGAGIMTLSASFAGVPGLNPSSNSQGLSLIVIPSVTGTLKITPTALDFGKVDIGDTKTKTVTIKNKGKITKKLTASSILIETESTDNAVFTIAMSCTDDSLVPKAKHQKAGKCTVQVTFTPTAAVAYSGNLDISDNLAPGLKNIVPMDGTGKTPKKPE